jgi:penicillin-binding protein 1C
MRFRIWGKFPAGQRGRRFFKETDMRSIEIYTKWIRAPYKRWLAILGILGTLASAFLVVSAWRHARLIAPPSTLYLLDRHGRFLGEVGAAEGQEYGYWPLETLPERVAAATIAVEDHRFHSHPGVDPIACIRAFRQNLEAGKRLSGASTLAMQVARIQNPGPRTYFRKSREALTAIFMTWRHGREAVLRHYLRIVPYGNRIHGIAYAARRYFSKPIEDLSWAEIAFLAAIPQAPARMNPFTATGHSAAARRGRKILNLLLAAERLSPEEYALACDQIRALDVPVLQERPQDALHAILRLEKMLLEAGHASLQGKRHIVDTTLDLNIQQEIAWTTFESLAEWEHQGAGNGAVIVLDRISNEVLAWIGSGDYFDRNHAGAIDYTSVPRSPGSTLKPFIYAQALERGIITPATILDDIERGAGGITNADKLFLGPLLPRVALANSRNVPAANLLQTLGTASGYDFMRDLELHDGMHSPMHFGLGLTIGTMPVTLEQLVRAYTVFSREGIYGDLIWYEDQPHGVSRRLLTEETARIVTLFLSDPMARLPSFTRMGALEYPFPVAVKTGTSSRYRDAWTVAFTPRFVVGVWIGDPDYMPMNHLTGYRSAAELVQRILFRLHSDDLNGLRDLGFPPPRGYEPIRLCALTGRLAMDGCPKVHMEWFKPGTGPTEYCTAHVLLAVDKRSGRPASSRTPAEHVEVRNFVDLPPRYNEWMTKAGLRPLPTLFDIASISGPDNTASAAHLTITAPENSMRLIQDPETPAENETLALKATMDTRATQLLWYVDGRPFQLVNYPYTARWPIEPGRHMFQVRLPNTPVVSAPIHVIVE